MVVCFHPGMVMYWGVQFSRTARSAGISLYVFPLYLYPTQILSSSSVSSTSSLVSAMLVNPFTRTACLTIRVSIHPHRRARPVVAPYSLPRSRNSSPRAFSCSVGKGPLPTRVVYALTIPTTSLIVFGPMPSPVQAPPAVGEDEVTKG